MKKQSQKHPVKTAGKRKAPKGSSLEVIDRLNQELQAHQIELEMQNEALRDSQRQLEESRNRYSVLYTFAPIGYFLLDRNALILEVNLKGSELFQIEGTLLTKTPFALYIVNEDRKAFYAYFKKVLKNESVERYSTQLRRKDGNSLPVEIHSVLIRDLTEGPLCLAVVTETADLRRDETVLEQRTAEAEKIRDLKTEFVSIISHELRTPLHALIGYTSLLLNQVYGPIHENQIDPLQGVSRNAKDLLSLINHLLDFSQIEAGKTQIALESIDIPALVREVIESARPAADEKCLEVRWSFPKNLPAVESDPRKIKQILTHLLTNAIKFTPQGMITITVRDLQEDAGIEVDIQDTGIGIRSEELDRIFDAFHQADFALTREYGGAGLGLAIVKNLIALLKGKIRVQSQYGKGSVFTVSIPYRFHS